MSAERPMKPYDRNEWQPGDAAVIGWRSTSGWERATRCIDGWHTETGSMPGHDDVEVARALLVIDPEDREQVERLATLFNTVRDPLQDVRWTLRQVLRAMLAPPKLYAENDGSLAPWPVVNECHSSYTQEHECPQCAWVHVHNWVAWTNATPNITGGPGVPIRCTKCGGRKCDAEECAQQRHHNGEHQGVTP